MDESVRVVEAKRPIFGDDWPNPPAVQPPVADQLARLERLNAFDPIEHRKQAVREILGGLRVAILAVLYTRDCLRAVSDRSQDVYLNDTVDHLEGLIEHWEREL